MSYIFGLPAQHSICSQFWAPIKQNSTPH